MRRFARWCLLLALGLGPVALVTSDVAASTVEALSLRELVTAADDIVVGQVISIEAHYDEHQRIVTDAILRTSEVMHGRARRGDLLTVRRIGGEVGDLGLRVEGEALLVPGENLVLFGRRIATRAVPSGFVLRPVGMSQGVLPIAEQDGVSMVMPGGEGLALVDRGADGRLVEGTPALVTPRSQDELLGELRELVQAVHGG